MPIHTFAPPPSLAAFVEFFVVVDGEDHEDGACPLDRERVLPDGTSLLVINLNKDENLWVYRPGASRHGHGFPETLLRGPQSVWYQFEASAATAQVGVHFKPGGVSPFFAPPSGELHNMHVPLDALWGEQAASELREQLLSAPGPEERVRLLARTMRAKAVRPLDPHPAVAFALRAFNAPYVPHAGPAQSCAWVADQTGLSHARFIQLFRDAVGLTPKHYYRIRRFLEVLRRTCSEERCEERVTWTELALECGYYDQSHLNHDFRAIAGMTPSAFMSAASWRPCGAPVAMECQTIALGAHVRDAS